MGSTVGACLPNQLHSVRSSKERVQVVSVEDSAACATVSAGAHVEAAVLRDPFVAAHDENS